MEITKLPQTPSLNFIDGSLESIKALESDLNHLRQFVVNNFEGDDFLDDTIYVDALSNAADVNQLATIKFIKSLRAIATQRSHFKRKLIAKQSLEDINV